MLRELSAIVLAGLCACSRGDPGRTQPDATAAPSAGAVPSAVATAPPRAATRPATEAVERVVRECQESAWGPSYKPCAALDAVRTLRLEKADGPALAQLLEDPRYRVAHLGGELAGRCRGAFRDDPGLQRRVLDVAEKLLDRPPVPLDKPLPAGEAVVDAALAGIVCGFDFSKGDALARAKSILKNGAASRELRTGLVSCLLAAVPQDEEIAALTRAHLDDADPLHVAARHALERKPPAEADCRAWAAGIAGGDEDSPEVYASLLLSGASQDTNVWISGFPDGSERNLCPAATLEAGLLAIERRAAAKKAVTEYLFFALGDLGLATNVAAATKARAYRFASAWFRDPKAPDEVRFAALYAMGKLDPTASRALAKRLLEADAAADADVGLARAASGLLKKQDERAAIATSTCD